MDFAGTVGRRNGDLWSCSHNTAQCVRWQRHSHTCSGSDGRRRRRDEASDDHGSHHSAKCRNNCAKCCYDRPKRRDNRARR